MWSGDGCEVHKIKYINSSYIMSLLLPLSFTCSLYQLSEAKLYSLDRRQRSNVSAQPCVCTRVCTQRERKSSKRIIINNNFILLQTNCLVFSFIWCAVFTANRAFDSNDKKRVLCICFSFGWHKKKIKLSDFVGHHFCTNCSFFCFFHFDLHMKWLTVSIVWHNKNLNANLHRWKKTMNKTCR